MDKKLGNKRDLKITVSLLIVLACIYVTIFIPPNLQSSRDANILVCNGPDENTQFSVVLKMVRGIKSTEESFLDHGHYYYGYPFYLISVLSILPIQLISTVINSNYTEIIVTTLREMSPFFMILSIILLVWMWTDFKNKILSVGLFLYLALIPSIFNNNFWWHPDSLVVFFVIATIFCLQRDEFDFRKWYFMAAVFCGLAISTKIIGIFFVITIPLYLGYAVNRGKISLRKSFKMAFLFLLTMVLSIILSYPILLKPEKALKVFQTLMLQSHQISYAQFSLDFDRPISHILNLQEWFGFWPILLLALIFGFLGIKQPSKRSRLLSCLCLSWIFPFGIYLFFFIRREANYYYIPLILPLLAMIGNPEVWKHQINNNRVISILIISVLCVQFAFFMDEDINFYKAQLVEEENCEALNFYHQMSAIGVFPIASKEKILVYRDPQIYFPPEDNISEKVIWKFFRYKDLEKDQPLLILLERRKYKWYVNPEVSSGMDYQFYRDANNNQLEDYFLLYSNNFGLIFKRNQQ